MEKLIICLFGLVMLAFQANGQGGFNFPMTGGWNNIQKYDKNLVGLSVRGINYINNYLGLRPGYRFVDISGQPKSQIVFGYNYNATVVIRLQDNPSMNCNFFIYRKPLLAPAYLDTTTYKVNCQDGQNFNFSVTIPGKK